MKEHRKKHFTDRGVNGHRVLGEAEIEKEPVKVEKVIAVAESSECTKVYHQFPYPVVPTLIKIENNL